MHKKGKKVIVIQPFCQHFRNTIEKLFVLWELVNTDVVHFHGDGEGGFIDTFLTAPVATPGKVEDDVEGVVEGPLVVAVT